MNVPSTETSNKKVKHLLPAMGHRLTKMSSPASAPPHPSSLRLILIPVKESQKGGAHEGRGVVRLGSFPAEKLGRSRKKAVGSSAQG